MARSRQEILQFYEEFRRHDGWEFLEGLRVFLPRLFRERPLEGCTFFTSHATLCITRSPGYPEWFETPLLMINCTAKDRLQFDLRITVSQGPVVRTVTQGSNCPVELGLDEFDRLFASLISAHTNRTNAAPVTPLPPTA